MDHSNHIWYVYGQFISYLSPRKNQGSATDFLHTSVSNRNNLLYNNFWYADNRKAHTGKQVGVTLILDAWPKNKNNTYFFYL